MNKDEYNSFCASLPATTHVVQWGGADVWKVGGKVFAIAGWSKEEFPYITFKCTPMSFDILKEQPGLRPAPYLAPRGGKWIQLHEREGLDEEGIRAYLTQSHAIVATKLTKKLKTELGLIDYLVEIQK